MNTQFWKSAVAGLVVACLCTTTVLAQSERPYRQPRVPAEDVSVNINQDFPPSPPAEIDSGNATAADSPSDAPKRGDFGNAGSDCGCANSGPCGKSCASECDSCHNCCDPCCGSCGCGLLDACKLDCPEACPEWKLFDCCCLQCHKITIAGWLEAGYTANAQDPASRYNGPVLFNDRDELMGNQLYIYAERATDSSDCCWDVGGRIDVLYGTDARFIQSLGLETHQDGTNKWNGERFYQLAMPQVYAEFARNCWKIKVGKFNTPLEYEVIAATGNFFYSHTYGFGYAVPFTQTGVYGTFDPGQQVAYGLGYTRGWDRWDDDNDKGNFTGHVTAKDCDSNNVVTFAVTTGDEFAVTGQDTNRTAYTINWVHKANDRTTWVLAHDLGVQQDGDPSGGNATWYGIEYYWMYQISCDWWFGARFEWFDDPEGTRVTQSSSGFGVGSGGNPATGPFPGSFYDITLGLNYKPLSNPNLIVRPELRYDWYSGKTPNGDPFDDGNSDDQFLFGIDLIYKF